MDEYVPQTGSVEPCPICTVVVNGHVVPVYHPNDRPCTLQALTIKGLTA